MEPLVLATLLATPSLPFAPMPTGHSTEVLAPTFDFQSGLTFDRQSVQMNVVPDPSDRCTTTIACDGSLALGLSFWIRGSFQAFTSPIKILAKVGPSRRSSPDFTPSRF